MTFSNPGEYFTGAEGFYDVFVRAEFFAKFLLGFLTFGTQHEDEGFFEVGVVLDGTAYLIAADLRHHDVEDKDIGRDLADFPECFSSVFCYPQGIPFVLEDRRESFPDILIIVRYQYFLLFHGVVKYPL